MHLYKTIYIEKLGLVSILYQIMVVLRRNLTNLHTLVFVLSFRQPIRFFYKIVSIPIHIL